MGSDDALDDASHLSNFDSNDCTPMQSLLSFSTHLFVSELQMANLVVRNIDAEIISALKARAGRRGVSAEAEHRRILEAALKRPKKKSFAQALKSIPPVGLDEDFQCIQLGESPDVFD